MGPCRLASREWGLRAAIGVSLVVLLMPLSPAGRGLMDAPASASLEAQPAATGPGVVVVRGDLLGPGGEPNRPRADSSFRSVCKMLSMLSIPHVVTCDSAVERDGLPGGGVAIFPYNRAVSDREAQVVERFVERGGKVLVLFTGRSDLLGWAGVRFREWRANAGRAAHGHLTTLRTLPGVEATLRWSAPQIACVELLEGSEATANWHSNDDAKPVLAAAAGPFGAFVGLLPEPEPTEQQARLLRAVLGETMPALWPRIVRTDAASVPLPTRFGTLGDLLAWLGPDHGEVGRPDATRAHAQQAVRCLAQARDALAGGDPGTALQLVTEATRLAQEASWTSYPSVPGELRGVWMHNYAEPSWPQALADVTAAHLNAVFPYMMSGGVAFYESAVLPEHKSVLSHGDYLRKAVAAAADGPVQVHARMLNMSLLFAPDGVRQSLRAQGRCAMDSSGRKLDWLCPSNEANRRVQVESARELVRYGVAGIQFDYLRYPSRSSCVCPTCRKHFERDLQIRVSRWPQDAITGGYRERFNLWRRSQITRIARDVSAAVRAERPDAYVSAAVFLNWEDHVVTFGQDWKAWIEEGIVDFVCPMNYTQDPARLAEYLQRQRGWVAGKTPLICGIGVYADGHRMSGPADLLNQVDVARANGSAGFVIFNYSPALCRDYLPWLAKGATSSPTAFDWLPLNLRRGSEQ